MSRSVRNQVRSGGSAFTLVELLVVISLISLLVALLMPALAAARDNGQTIKCVSNMRSFMQGLQVYLTDAREIWPAKQASDWAGTATNYFDPIFANQYLFPEAMICPTAPAYYGFISYAAPGVQPYNKSDVMFSNIWKGKNGYNLPFGTYYWMAGATEGSNNSFYYYMNQTSVAGGPTFQFRSSHIGDPSRYAPVWDQDTRRNATVRTRDYTSHAFNPGRTFTFADGHARFYPDSGSETRECTLADTNYLRGAEHITPYYHSYCVMYAANKTSCGATYNNAVPSNPRPTALTRGILTIPSN